jgi:hypothetical protein
MSTFLREYPSTVPLWKRLQKKRRFRLNRRRGIMRKKLFLASLVGLAIVGGLASLVDASDTKAQMEKSKGEMKAQTEEAKGEAKALTEEAKGNKTKAEMERAKGNVKGAGERAKGESKAAMEKVK